jgi:hypothetical protein
LPHLNKSQALLLQARIPRLSSRCSQRTLLQSPNPPCNIRKACGNGGSGPNQSASILCPGRRRRYKSARRLDVGRAILPCTFAASYPRRRSFFSAGPRILALDSINMHLSISYAFLVPGYPVPVPTCGYGFSTTALNPIPGSAPSVTPGSITRNGRWKTFYRDDPQLSPSWSQRRRSGRRKVSRSARAMQITKKRQASCRRIPDDVGCSHHTNFDTFSTNPCLF